MQDSENSGNIGTLPYSVHIMGLYRGIAIDVVLASAHVVVQQLVVHKGMENAVMVRDPAVTSELDVYDLIALLKLCNSWVLFVCACRFLFRWRSSINWSKQCICWTCRIMHWIYLDNTVRWLLGWSRCQCFVQATWVLTVWYVVWPQVNGSLKTLHTKSTYPEVHRFLVIKTCIIMSVRRGRGEVWHMSNLHANCDMTVAP